MMRDTSSASKQFRATLLGSAGVLPSTCTPVNVAILYDPNGGSAVADDSCVYDEQFDLSPAPSLTGYVFQGWSLINN